MEFIKYVLRTVAQYYDEGYSEPNCIADAVSCDVSPDEVRNEIKKYMKENPKATEKQANVQVAYNLGLICTQGYEMAVRNLKKSGQWVK